MERIGFIGLGNMGKGICQCLLRNGYPLTVYDISKKAMEAFEGKAKLAGNPIELLVESDVVMLSLPSSEQVEEYAEVFLSEGIKGKIVIDLSTSDPLSTQGIYKRFKAAGGDLIDSPLLGAPSDAEPGTLLVLSGGDREAYDRIADILDCLAAKGQNYYMGESCTGHFAKLAINCMGSYYVAAYAQIFPLAEKMGMNTKLLYDITCASTLGCGVLTFYGPKIIDSSYTMAFALELAHKDTYYMKKIFESYKVPGFALDGVLDLMRTAIKDGRGPKDFSEIAATSRDFLRQ